MFTNEKETSRNFEIWVEKKNASRVEKKNTRVEKERTLTSCVVNRCLHFTDTRLRSKVAVCWLPNIAEFFFCLGRLIEDLERQLSSVWYDSSEFLFGRLDEYKRTLATGCAHVVKILWDLRLFRNREVHPFYVKSDWNPPVQPLEALERG